MNSSLIGLFSDPNFLAVNVLINLLSTNKNLLVITDDKKSWKNIIRNIPNSGSVQVVDRKEFSKYPNISFALFFGGFINKRNSLNDFKLFASQKKLTAAKTVAIFPFETFEDNNKLNVQINQNASILYIGDLLGPGINLESNLLVSTLINEVVKKKILTLGMGEVFFPVSSFAAAKVICRLMYTNSIYGKRIFLLGGRVSASSFWKESRRITPNLNIVLNTDYLPRKFPKNGIIKRIPSNFPTDLAKTHKWILENILNPVRLPKDQKLLQVKNEVKTKTRKPLVFFTKKNISKSKPAIQKSSNTPITNNPKKRSINKYLKLLVTLTWVFMFLPLITVLISVMFLYLSYANFNSENINNSLNMSVLAKSTFSLSVSESEMLSRIPIIGLFYRETAYISYIGEKVSESVPVIVPAFKSGKDVFSNIFSMGAYNPQQDSLQLKSSLDYIYRELSVVQLETKDKAQNGVLSAKQILGVIDFDKFKNYTQQLSVLSGKITDLLGLNSNKNYLVLFENNMELRPTGGFIGSYGIINFGGGKINGLAINDIYSADGQLKGHVEPPTPIKNILGEANWFFRDSNWSPDFSTSAQRAEWFLGKEMNQQVDGVVSFDLVPVKNILDITGPIFLPDYDLTISSDNLYEKTQEEVQSNFFPGSRKKASFLTALSRSIIDKISGMNTTQKLKVLYTFYKGLEERNIQIYLHDQSAKNAINKLAWDGGVQLYSCGDGCYSDFFGDVEANLGVNKANYFINRDFNFSATIQDSNIKRSLDVNIKNSANVSLGPSGIYKNYMRILIPNDATLTETSVSSGQSQMFLKPDLIDENGYKEVGIYIEIMPGEQKKVNFVWESVLNKNDTSYGLFVRKQAGTLSDKININILPPKHTTGIIPAFNLTDGGYYTYNTVLAKDFFARLSW